MKQQDARKVEWVPVERWANPDSNETFELGYDEADLIGHAVNVDGWGECPREELINRLEDHSHLHRENICTMLHALGSVAQSVGQDDLGRVILDLELLVAHGVEHKIAGALASARGAVLGGIGANNNE